MHRRTEELIANMCLIQLRAMGIDVEITNDHARSFDLMEQLKKPIFAANSPEKLLLTRKNSFFVFALKENKPIAGFGVRVDDLGDEDVQSFLPRSIEMIFDVKVVSSDYDVFAGCMWGKAAYFGNLGAVNASGLGSSGKSVLRLLTGYIHHRVTVDLGADTAYCILRERDLIKSKAYGFLDASPWVWQTDKLVFPDENPGWIGHLQADRRGALMASLSNFLTNSLAADEKSLSAVPVRNVAGG